MSLCRYIQSIGVGYNQFPLEELQKREIVLCNAVGVNLYHPPFYCHSRIRPPLLICVLIG